MIQQSRFLTTLVSGTTTISNNTFSNVGLNTTNLADVFDSSIIYVDSYYVTVNSNTFTGRLVNGTTIGAMGATTAIEIHGANHTITNNVISYFNCGMNAVESNMGLTDNNQFYQYNTMNDVGTGLSLWTGDGGPSWSFLDNTITIDADDWAATNCPQFILVES